MLPSRCDNTEIQMDGGEVAQNCHCLHSTMRMSSGKLQAYLKWVWKSFSGPISLCQTGLNMVLAYESNVYVAKIPECKQLQCTFVVCLRHDLSQVAGKNN